jgi:DNA-binding transcriptional ArsR family regulator
MPAMARAATTSDPFNAIAEPVRRQILALLAERERPVNEIAEQLGIRQPQASKHLRVLKEVGLVSARSVGQQRLYSINAAGLKTVHDWVVPFRRLWEERLDRLDDYLRELQARQADSTKEIPHDDNG